jgi:signal transduction histidine kinase
VVGASVAGELRNATTIAWLLPLAGGAVLFVGLIIGSLIITRAVRPVEQIEATAAEISKGKLSARVQIETPDSELGQLSSVLNATFARLQAAFDRQQQFTSDAAHELRTPLAIMILEAQTSLARPRTAAEYKQSVEDCLETAQQMRRLADTLLDLARLEVSDANAERAEIDLAEIVLRCIRRLEPTASNREVALKYNLLRAPVLSFPERMVLVVTNLLINAINYNRPGGEVVVTTGSSGTNATLSVVDAGIGIGPADLPRIFDRFYRVDKARSRAGGHAGLGLSICKAIIDAEHGMIQVQSEIGKGTVFTIRLPLAPRPDLQ